MRDFSHSFLYWLDGARVLWFTNSTDMHKYITLLSLQLPFVYLQPHVLFSPHYIYVEVDVRIYIHHVGMESYHLRRSLTLMWILFPTWIMCENRSSFPLGAGPAMPHMHPRPISHTRFIMSTFHCVIKLLWLTPVDLSRCCVRSEKETEDAQHWVLSPRGPTWITTHVRAEATFYARVIHDCLIDERRVRN